MEETHLDPDWLARQIASTQEEVAGWPEWLRLPSKRERITPAVREAIEADDERLEVCDCVT